MTWLTGAPGAVAYYCVAGAIVALPSHLWVDIDLGRWLFDHGRHDVSRTSE